MRDVFQIFPINLILIKVHNVGILLKNFW